MHPAMCRFRQVLGRNGLFRLTFSRNNILKARFNLDELYLTVFSVTPCHPERSEGSVAMGSEILPCAHDDSRHSPETWFAFDNVSQTLRVAQDRTAGPCWARGTG